MITTFKVEALILYPFPRDKSIAVEFLIEVD